MGKVIITIQEGNLGKDAETKVFDGGSRVTRFPVAVTHSVKQEDGQWKDIFTEWTEVVLWNRLSDRFSHLKKGNRVTVTGYKKTRISEDNTGKKYYNVECVATYINQIVVRESKTGSWPTANDAPAYAQNQSNDGFRTDHLPNDGVVDTSAKIGSQELVDEDDLPF